MVCRLCLLGAPQAYTDTIMVPTLSKSPFCHCSVYSFEFISPLSRSMPLTSPAGLHIYRDTGLPLKQFWYYLQRQIRIRLKLTSQAASVTFMQTAREGKGTQKLPWKGCVKGLLASAISKWEFAVFLRHIWQLNEWICFNFGLSDSPNRQHAFIWLFIWTLHNSNKTFGGCLATATSYWQRSFFLLTPTFISLTLGLTST